MKKAQFVSPIIILAIIIISTIILSVQTTIKSELEMNTADYGTIIDDIISVEQEDLEYQNNLTIKVLTLLSTLNSSGTINKILSSENAVITHAGSNVIIEYNKDYGTALINNTLLVPYPYSNMLYEEQRFNSGTYADCMTSSCANFESCTNNYDTGTIDWEPVTCMTSPLRVRIRVKMSGYPLTSDFPYYLWNNTSRIIS